MSGARDWGKPAQLECSACGRRMPLGFGCFHVAVSWTMLPVYAPIDEGERPEAAEPDDGTVVAQLSRPSGLLTVSAVNTWRHAIADDYRFVRYGERGKFLLNRGSVPTLADAVLWVVEGTR